MRDDDSRDEARCLNAEARAYRKHALAPDACECGACDWALAGADVYGADADGNRGVPCRLWVCVNCHAEREVIYR